MSSSTTTGTGMFRSLRVHDYRIWAAGALVSNVGTWMQRTAQDWIVLTQLTHNDAFAVGITMALQFGPQLLLLPVTGLAADRIPKRTLMMMTQAAMGLLGARARRARGAARRDARSRSTASPSCSACVAAFDAPARQSFVSELVPPERPDERGRPELRVVQRGAAHRAVRRGAAHRGRRPGLGVPHQRGELRGSARLARVHPPRAGGGDRAPGPGRHGLRRGLPLRRIAPGPASSCSR